MLDSAAKWLHNISVSYSISSVVSQQMGKLCSKLLISLSLTSSTECSISTKLQISKSLDTEFSNTMERYNNQIGLYWSKS